MLTIQKEMLRSKTKLDDLLEGYKDLDHVYIKNRLEEYDDSVQYYSIYAPNNKWRIPMLDCMNGENW